MSITLNSVEELLRGEAPLALFCTHVKAHYEELLTRDERSLLLFLHAAEPHIGQRACNILLRKSEWVSIADEEIPESVTAALVAGGVLGAAADISAPLSVARKGTIVEICRRLGVCVYPSAPKASLIGRIWRLGRTSDVARSLDLHPATHRLAFQTLSFLFFGTSRSSFGAFYSRAGARYVAEPAVACATFVHSRAQLDALLALERFKQTDLIDVNSFVMWAREMRSLNYLDCDYLHLRLENAIPKLARRIERKQRHEDALALYELRDCYHSLTGRARVLRKLGKSSVTKKAVDTALANPGTLAQRYTQEVERSSGAVTRAGPKALLLKESATLMLEAVSGRGVEHDACVQFQRSGKKAFHIENSLIGWLYRKFCLELVCPKNVSLRPLNMLMDDVPVLYTEIFPFSYSRELSAAFEEIESWVRAQLIIEHSPGSTMTEAFTAFLRHSSMNQIRRILEYVSEAPHERLRGYPDLLVVDNGISFVEIKGVGDTVRLEQLAAIEILRALGYNARVVRAHYDSSVRSDVRHNERPRKRKIAEQLPLFEEV